METKQKYLRDIRDAINGVETAMPGVAGESEATYLRDIAKAIRSSGIDPSIPKVTDADNGKILKVVNGVWAKADDEGVLYGEETPASTLGKDGDVYVQYEMSEMEIPVLVEDKTIPIGGSDNYITDVTATDYDAFLFVMDFYYPNDSTLFAHVEQIVKPNDITDGNYVSIRRPAYADVLGIINTASAPNEGKIQLSTPSWQYGVKYSIYDISSIILTPTTLVMPASEYSQGALYRSGIIVNDYNTIRLQVIMKNGDSRVDERCLDIDLDDVKNYDGPYGNDYPVFRPQTSNPLIFIRKDHLLSSGELVFIGGDSYDRYIDISVVSPLPSSEPGSLTDIYLKVDGEWVKDGFGKDKEPEQPESISLLHLDEDFVNDQITDAKGNTYSIMTGTTGVSMTNETKRFGEKCLSMNGQGWVNSEILGDKLDFKNGDFTIDLWVRPSDTWRMCPICLPGNGLLIDLNNGIARIWFVNENGQLVVHADGGGNGFGTIPVPANVWTHIAYVREGNYVALFVNGKLDIYVYIGSINKQYIPESSRIRLGNWDNGDLALYTYSGYIDEVRVTNKAMWHIFDNIPTEPYTK